MAVLNFVRRKASKHVGLGVCERCRIVFKDGQEGFYFTDMSGMDLHKEYFCEKCADDYEIELSKKLL